MPTHKEANSYKIKDAKTPEKVDAMCATCIIQSATCIYFKVHFLLVFRHS